MYASYADTRKAISYAVLYHVEKKMFSVYIKGLTIDLRTGEEADPMKFSAEEIQFLYSNQLYRLMYFSSYEKAKACFDELVRNCMEDMYGYPDLLIERFSQQGVDLSPDWYNINSNLQYEERNFGRTGFSKN